MALDATQKAPLPPPSIPEAPSEAKQSPPITEQVNQVGQAALPLYPDGILHRWDNLFTANTGIHTWDVLLIKEGNVLKYRLENRQTKQCKIGSLLVNPGLAQDIFIKTLIERCEPVLEAEGAEPFFSSRLCEYIVPGQFEDPIIKVCLLKGKQQLFWQKWDPHFATRTYVPIALTFPTHHCSESTQAAIREISQWTPATAKKNLTSNYRCIRFEHAQVGKLNLPKPEIEKETFSFEVGCKCTYEIFEDGRIKILLYDYEKPPREATVNHRTYSIQLKSSLNIHRYLFPFFVKKDAQIKCLLLTQEQIQAMPWKAASRHFNYKLEESVTPNQFSFELISSPETQNLPCKKTTAATVTSFVHVHCSMATWVESGGRSNSSFLSTTASVLPHFYLSFPIDTRISVPLSKVSFVELEPCFVSSFFDKTVPITTLRWGFTLLAYRGSQGNHAAGIIEALNDGFFPEKERGAHVKFHFHFTGDEIECKYLEQIHFEERSKVILISVENAKKIVESVKEAKSKQPPPFDQRGIDAWGSKGHSCFTWLREVVKANGIDLGKSLLGFMITRTKNWTEKDYPPQNELL